MTMREFYTHVAEGTVTEEDVVFAQERITKLDETNAKRVEKNAEKAAEKEAVRAPIREAIVACMTDEPKTASTLIAEAGVEIKPQAIPSLLKALIEAGTLEKVDVKVKGKGTQKGYKLA